MKKTVVSFYEATDLDKKQLLNLHNHSELVWTYYPDAICTQNLNPETEVLSVFLGAKIDENLMKKMPKLKLITTRSTGFDHIDMDYAKTHGITVTNVPTYGENTVAEYAFMLLLSVMRKTVPTVEATEKGQYNAPDLVGNDLLDKTFGIVGLGHIGQHAAKIANGFGMKVLAFDMRQNPELAKKLNLEYVSFDDLLAKSDIVSLHTPLNPGTFHLMNKDSFAKMKKGSILINTARGGLVENRAFIEALKNGHLAGAGVDTLEGEHFLSRENMLKALTQNSTAPTTYEQAAESAVLLSMPNVVLTQHAAYNTSEAIDRINQTTSENILSFLAENPKNCVNLSQKTGNLVIMRHAQSTWNSVGKWTGSTDVDLSNQGINEATEFGQKLAGSDINFDYAYYSGQKRSKQTLDIVLKSANQANVPNESSTALNERDYGIYTGMDKNKIKETIGEDAYQKLSRSWDSQVEGGESLKDVYQRTVPFYLRIILPRLMHGQNVLVVAHGNSLRSLMKYIENLNIDKVGDIKLGHNEALIYRLTNDGRQKDKKVIK